MSHRFSPVMIPVEPADRNSLTCSVPESAKHLTRSRSITGSLKIKIQDPSRGGMDTYHISQILFDGYGPRSRSRIMILDHGSLIQDDSDPSSSGNLTVNVCCERFAFRWPCRADGMELVKANVM